MNNLERYELLRNNILPGDMISWKGNGIVSWAILRFSTHSHVSVVAASPTNHPDRRMVMEAWEGEVNLRALSSRLESYSGEAYLHTLKKELEEFRFTIDKCLWEIIGKKYDYKSLFSNLLGYVSTQADTFFCSELVGYAITRCIPNNVLSGYLPNKEMEMLLKGKALRPGDIAALPLYESPLRLI